MKLLAIDWSKISVRSDADALDLWRQIAPTGEDWEAKLEEVPDGPIASALALALLRDGNFRCVAPSGPGVCPAAVPADIEPPAADATFDNPCLRRMLALWAIPTLDDDDLPAAHDALAAIAALPPPESQLVAATFEAYPETDQDHRLELRAIAFAAGNRDLVNASGHLSTFDDDHLLQALQRHHIDGALDLLPSTTHRAAFLAAITDDQLAPAGRIAAITELVSAVEDPVLPRDLRNALATATKATDCRVAAAAARALVQHREKTFAPTRPHTHATAAMMRSLCVVASYEAAQKADEPSYLLDYVATTGMDEVNVTYDPYNDQDTDGDGDPHTERTLTHVPRDQVIFPDVENMVAAFAHCDGTVCHSSDWDYRFGFKPGAGGELRLSRLEIVERRPCK